MSVVVLSIRRGATDLWPRIGASGAAWGRPA
jgi:hypothetical protein